MLFSSAYSLVQRQWEDGVHVELALNRFFFLHDSVNPNIFFLGNSIQIFNKMLLEFENLQKNKLEIGHVLVLYNISPSGGRVWVRIVPHLHQVFYTLIQ